MGRTPATWKPSIDVARSRVRIGSRPIDLGGIGKGFAVREALDRLRGHARSALVEAGGDLAVFGPGPQGPGWRVSVEDPTGGSNPVAVLEVRDAGVATSSIRRRQWAVEGHAAHHLIDPRTADPARSGLRSVTVVAADTVQAEVVAKALFLSGRSGVRDYAESEGTAALWVDDEGRVGYSRSMTSLLLWKVSRVGS